MRYSAAFNRLISAIGEVDFLKPALSGFSVFLLLGMNAASYAETGQTNTQSEQTPSHREQLPYNHCLIYNAAGCPGMNAGKDAITATERNAASMPVWSGKAGSAKAAVAVDLNNLCRWIDNAPGNATTDVFVPFRTDEEWNAFVTAGQTAGSGASQFVSLVDCSRPGTAAIPDNDPANPPSDSAALCYDQNGNLQTSVLPFQAVAYGRVGELRTIAPAGLSFQCYSADGTGPWSKTVVSAELNGLDADRPGGSSANPANSDWQVLAVTYTGTPPQPVIGVCGSTVNGQKVSSAPSGSALCDAGTPTAVNGSGPWTWTCQGGTGGRDSGTCQANTTTSSCPVADAEGTSVMCGGSTLISFPGIMGQVNVSANAAWDLFNGACYLSVSYLNGKCTASYDINTKIITVGFDGVTSTYGGMYGPGFNSLVLCIATEFARQNLAGYSNCTPSSWTGNATSPIKISLANGDAKLNSDTATSYYLTLQEGRILEGHVKGGLNADEGWLMVRRSAAPLVYNNGGLNADDWFGDRDHRSLNGYTDLAETFADFLQKNEYGERFIPLHPLTDKEKAEKAKAAQGSADYKVTDPSFDLRIIDANNKELFASDYFDRILIEYRNVVEGDGPDGKGGDNIILERGIVHTLQGENHGAIDQWFILDLPADYHDPGHPTQSKVWPAPAAR